MPFRVELLGFPGVPDEEAAQSLMDVFGLDPELTDHWVKGFVVKVRSSVSRAEAKRYTKALVMMGAEVQVTDLDTDEVKLFGSDSLQRKKTETSTPSSAPEQRVAPTGPVLKPSDAERQRQTLPETDHSLQFKLPEPDTGESTESDSKPEGLGTDFFLEAGELGADLDGEFDLDGPRPGERPRAAAPVPIAPHPSAPLKTGGIARFLPILLLGGVLSAGVAVATGVFDVTEVETSDYIVGDPRTSFQIDFELPDAIPCIAFPEDYRNAEACTGMDPDALVAQFTSLWGRRHRLVAAAALRFDTYEVVVFVSDLPAAGTDAEVFIRLLRDSFARVDTELIVHGTEPNSSYDLYQLNGLPVLRAFAELISTSQNGLDGHLVSHGIIGGEGAIQVVFMGSAEAIPSTNRTAVQIMSRVRMGGLSASAYDIGRTVGTAVVIIFVVLLLIRFLSGGRAR